MIIKWESCFTWSRDASYRDQEVQVETSRVNFDKQLQ